MSQNDNGASHSALVRLSDVLRERTTGVEEDDEEDEDDVFEGDWLEIEEELLLQGCHYFDYRNNNRSIEVCNLYFKVKGETTIVHGNKYPKYEYKTVCIKSLEEFSEVRQEEWGWGEYYEIKTDTDDTTPDDPFGAQFCNADTPKDGPAVYFRSRDGEREPYDFLNDGYGQLVDENTQDVLLSWEKGLITMNDEKLKLYGSRIHAGLYSYIGEFEEAVEGAFEEEVEEAFNEAVKTAVEEAHESRSFAHARVLKK